MRKVLAAVEATVPKAHPNSSEALSRIRGDGLIQAADIVEPWRAAIAALRAQSIPSTRSYEGSVDARRRDVVKLAALTTLAGCIPPSVMVPPTPVPRSISMPSRPLMTLRLGTAPTQNVGKGPRGTRLTFPIGGQAALSSEPSAGRTERPRDPFTSGSR
jgi:hypothetical protein